ncbi:MAG TPA: hypothetical protein VI703_11915 [Anaerolineales bacterium]|nr:hypothetical protein [Anaerolineales bacterium]
MSDIFFTDASEAPLPPSEVRIRALDATPRADGVRIDVHLELTPFQRRPNIDVAIADPDGREVSALSVVEAIDNKMDFTMHLRQAKPEGQYSLIVDVFYTDVQANVSTNGGQKSAGEILDKGKNVVDYRTVEFEVLKGN